MAIYLPEGIEHEDFINEEENEIELLREMATYYELREAFIELQKYCIELKNQINHLNKYKTHE